MKRNQGIDLLRIFAMLLVVTMHYLGHGGVIANTSEDTCSNYIWIMFAICHTAVNMFILISGYCAYGKSINVKRIVELWLQILFYTISIWGVFAGISYFLGDLSKYLANRNDIIMSFSPVLHRTYGFMTLFIVMSLFMPIIANAIQELDKLKYILIVLMFFFVCNSDNFRRCQKC